MPFVIFRSRSREKSWPPLPGQILSRGWFTLCITMEVEPRNEKQYKCHYCRIYKNYRGQVMEDGGGGGRSILIPTLRPAKTEETVSHRQNNSVKEVGTPPVRSNLCTSLIAVSIAVRSKVTETVSEKQLLRNNSAARQTILL